MQKKYSIMKRMPVRIAAVCLGLALIGVVVWAVAVPRGTAHTRSAQRRGLTGLDTYDVSARLLDDSGELSVTQTLHMTNTTGQTLSSLVMRTYAGAYADEEYAPAAMTELYDACYGAAFSPGDITVYGTWWEDKPVAATFTDEAHTVLEVQTGDILPNAQGTLMLQYVLKIPACAHRFGVSGEVYRFINALPTLARFEKGAWRTDALGAIGDVLVGDCANWRFSLKLPQGYTAYAGTPLNVDGDTWTGELAAASDFAFCFSKQLAQRTGMAAGVRLVSAARQPNSAQAALVYLQKAVAAFQKLYGDAPYDTLVLCAVDMPAIMGGQSQPGIIFLSESDYAVESALELKIAHEVAHQWFGAMVGTDAVNHPWQDEAVCEWAMLQYVKGEYGQASMDALKFYRIDSPMRENIAYSVTPGSPAHYFPDFSMYQAVVMGRGAAFLEALNEMLLGRLDECLKAYAEEYAFRFASRDAFLAAVNAFSGMDVAPLMVDYLDTYMVN